MNYFFVPCEDEGCLAGLTRVYLAAEKAYQTARQARGYYGQWKSHVEGAQKSKALLSDDQKEKDRALQELANRTETFICARLNLAAAHAPLVKATSDLLNVLRELLNDDAVGQLEKYIQTGKGKIQDRRIYPFHADILRVNMHIASELLLDCLKLVSDPAFEDRASIENELPRTLESLLGSKAKLVYLPKLRGTGATLRGVAAWSAQILKGQTQLSFGPEGEMWGYPEAARNIFADVGWEFEHQAGTDGGRSTYKVTQPDEPPEDEDLY